MMNNFFHFLGQKHSDKPQESYHQYPHYPHIEALLESGNDCGLCNILIYSLKHGDSPEGLPSHARFSNRLFEIAIIGNILSIATPISVNFTTDNPEDYTKLPSRRYFNATCGNEDGPLWYGIQIHWAPLPGEVPQLDQMK
jgi:hypothetical protein